MRTDLVRTYKDVHIWAGILSGLALFIAFYAGAITMFEQPLARWAATPLKLSVAPAIEDSDRLVRAVLASHPEAAADYMVHLGEAGRIPARMTWHVEQPAPPGERFGEEIEFAASLSADGKLEVVQVKPPAVAELIDVLHQQVGLPFEHEISMPIMGAVSLLYAVALISGVIILLPSLVKDLFALRIGKNLKRMWLDAHNVVGIFSLPFHIVMALTAVIFAFHDQIYDAQDKLLWRGGLEAAFERGDAPHLPLQDAPPLAVPDLKRKIETTLPGFAVTAIAYRQEDGQLSAEAIGRDPRFLGQRLQESAVEIDPATGTVVDSTSAPGGSRGKDAVVNSFFALHFGGYGGEPVRWGYFLLGLGGAFLFYSGNLLWIESRRKKARRGNMPEQTRAARVMGSLTVGIALGCVSGISATVAAARWIAPHVSDLSAAHNLIYYGVFLAVIGWAFWRGAARAAPELLLLCAFATLAIPVTSLFGPTAGFSGGWPVDLVAAVGALIFLICAVQVRRRAAQGPADSIWASERPLQNNAISA